MQIMNSIRQYQPIAFGTFIDATYDANGILENRGDTCMCREDLEFIGLVNFLDKKYSSTPKVNVVIHACSNGEEVYSFLAVLKSKLGGKSKKFTPVLAKDVDKNRIKLAKKGEYNLKKDEYAMLNAYLKGKADKYFVKEKREKQNKNRNNTINPHFRYCETPVEISVGDSLKKDVKFEQGDIFDDVENMDLRNTVFFARNFWPYLKSEKDINRLAKLFAEKMDSSSTLIIGDFDRENRIDKVLKKVGFVETEVEKVFELPKDYNYNVNQKDTCNLPSFKSLYY